MEVHQFLVSSPFVYRMVPADGLVLFYDAFTHNSYANERDGRSYERLDFFGNAILEFIVCEEVYRGIDLMEGAMINFKQDKVSSHTVSKRVPVFDFDLDEIAMVGGGHRGPDGTEIEESMRANCFEAVLAVVYLTYGMNEARRIARVVILRNMPSDPSRLPELG